MINRNTTFTSVAVSPSYLLRKWTDTADLLNFHMAVHLTVIFLFSVSIIIMVICYITALTLLIYQKVNKLNNDFSSASWDKARLCIAHLIMVSARIIHGYEILGTENLPQGPCLIVFYHGATAIDYFFFLAGRLLLQGKWDYSVGDNFLYKIPGFKILLGVMKGTRGSKEECMEILKNGHSLGISPGGLREALFSDDSYKLIWGNRTGFAQLAIDAKVPIIPMFTENIRDGYRTFNTRPFRWLYERTRLPLVPIYGCFPVKLRAHIGEPIPYDPNTTSDELTKKTKNALETLIRSHQKIPGNLRRSILERFDKQQKED